MTALTRRDLLAGAGGLAVAAALAPARLGSAAIGERTVDPMLRELARLVDGPVITPAQAQYEQARLPYNARFSSVRPLAVVRPASVEDVRQIVRWSARTGVRLAPRSGGHSYAGYSTTTGVVVDLTNFRRVTLGSDGRATVGAGARLWDVYPALAAHGRAIPAGSCPTVGIGGLTLGGGFGLASRAWGLTCDNLTEVQLVTADGRVLTCDPRRHSDLFWACRGGGGGNFGIATRFRFRTRPVASGSYFTVTWAWDDLEDVVRRFQSWAPHAPDGVGSILRLATGPASPTLQVFGQYLGPEKSLPALLAQLTTGLSPTQVRSGRASWLDLQRRWAGCLGESDTSCRAFEPIGFAAASDYVDAPLGTRAIATMRSWMERRQGASGALLFDAYGGAVNRVPRAATAFVHRDVRGSFQYFSSWSTPSAGPSTHAWIRGFHGAMRPFVSGFAYQNYIDPDLATWKHAYYGSNLPRLIAVKARYDPQRLFRFAQAIPVHA